MTLRKIRKYLTIISRIISLILSSSINGRGMPSVFDLFAADFVEHHLHG